MLISLFQVSTVRCLVLLEILEIIDCRCLEYIVIDERKREEYSRGEIVVDDDDIDSKSRDSMFPKLKVLKIEKCPELELILSTHDLPALESITLKRCDKLKYKFDQYVKLGSLKNMELDGLSNLIDISPECYGTMTSSIKGPSSVSRDASKPQKQSDPIKCNIFSWTMSTACTKTPLVSEDQPHENLIATHIIIDTGDHDSGSKKLCNVFPKLKSVYIEDCVQLEYIFGDYTDHHQNQCEIHLHLSSLECLSLCNLPNFVAMSPKQYYTTFPPLKELVLKECSQFANVKSIGDFISHHSVARSVDSTIMKETSEKSKTIFGLFGTALLFSKLRWIFTLTWKLEFVASENHDEKAIVTRDCYRKRITKLGD
ncbi:putative CC-NBS-LRR resistance protein [Trifolium pratense]|nr:putative CC-NBS-LRR resistance protein [Trifolium pratense]